MRYYHLVVALTIKIMKNHMSKKLKHTKAESVSNDGCQGLGGGESRELPFNGCTVSILEDEKCYGDG